MDNMNNLIEDQFDILEGSCKVIFREKNAGYMPSLKCENRSIHIPLLLSHREVEHTLYKLFKLPDTTKHPMSFFYYIVAGACSLSMKYHS